ncbi:MAG: signal peptidase I [Candidatus Omnitrophica bacterium]|nr:signal peptidase I [Candidatus Omnitrophota bacterium]
MNKFRTWTYWWREWLYPFMIALILALIIRAFIVQPFKIPSTSMYPTLKIGDRIFVNKFLYGASIPFTDKILPKVREPKRGDIIVFVSPTDPKVPDPADQYKRLVGPVFWDKGKNFFKWYAPRYLVKRLIGLPGDQVEIKSGNIFINDKKLENSRIDVFTYYNGGEFAQENKKIIVPEEHFFVLGDNSGNSVDSRFWGFVPEKNLNGKVFLIWWPIQRVRFIA